MFRTSSPQLSRSDVPNVAPAFTWGCFRNFPANARLCRWLHPASWARDPLYRRRLPHPGMSDVKKAAERDSGAPLIGVVNAGSSSLKFAFYEGERRILAGQVDGIGVHPSAKATGPDGAALDPPALGPRPPSTPGEVVPALIPWARQA